MTAKTKWKTETHSLFSGKCEVYTTKQSNGVYQIGVWMDVEGKIYLNFHIENYQTYLLF